MADIFLFAWWNLHQIVLCKSKKKNFVLAIWEGWVRNRAGLGSGTSRVVTSKQERRSTHLSQMFFWTKIGLRLDCLSIYHLFFFVYTCLVQKTDVTAQVKLRWRIRFKTLMNKTIDQPIHEIFQKNASWQTIILLLNYKILTSICGLPKAVTLMAAKPSLDAPPILKENQEIKLELLLIYHKTNRNLHQQIWISNLFFFRSDLNDSHLMSKHCKNCSENKIKLHTKKYKTTWKNRERVVGHSCCMISFWSGLNGITGSITAAFSRLVYTHPPQFM